MMARSAQNQPGTRAGILLSALDARAKLAFLAVFMVAALRASGPVPLGLCLGVSVALAAAVRLDARTVRAVLLPLAPILAFTMAMQAASFQEGPALAHIGGFALTWRALAESERMLACLLALVLASVSFMRCTAVEELVALLRWLLRPLRMLGLRTDAFVLALSVALGFAPVLVGEFMRLRTAQMARLADFEGSLRARVAAYARLFAPLLASSFSHADSLADAFLARGFSCHPAPTQLHPGKFGAPEAACLAAACALLAASLLL